MKTKVNLIPFTNKIGQVINPGDLVVVVTTGYNHSVHDHVGFYIGVNSKGKVQYSRKITIPVYYFKDTDQRVGVKFFQELNSKLTEFDTQYVARTGLRDYYKNPDRKIIRDSYMSKVELRKSYISRKFTLKLNRIYKLA